MFSICLKFFQKIFTDCMTASCALPACRSHHAACGHGGADPATLTRLVAALSSNI